MPGPLAALAGRLVATRGGATLARAGTRVATTASRARRVASARIGRAIGPKGRKLLKGARRQAGIFGDMYMAQRAMDSGRNDAASAKAIRKGELIRGAIGGKKYLSGGSEAGVIPAKKSPKTAREVTKPSISAINDQLGDLLKVVTHIRDISKDRQNTLLKNEVDAVKATEENNLEANIPANDNEGPDAIPEATESGDSDLGSTFDAFSEALDSLTQTIQDLIDGQGTGEQQSQGFGDAFMMNWRRGRGTGPGGRGFSRNSAVGRGEAQLSNMTSRARAGASARLGGLATNVRESAAVTRIGGAIRSTAGAATAKMARGAGATKDVVRRLARPILAKSLGKTALKSIPLIGAVAGVGFAIGKLLEGDFVGAGLEAASGLAGPATAIPAFILSVARDIYSGVYGVPPEQDPQFAERMPEIQDAVKAEAASIMSPQVETKEGVTSSSGGIAAAAGVAGGATMATMAAKAASPTMAAPGGSPSGSPTASSGQPSAPPSGAPPAAPQAEPAGTNRGKATLASGGGPTSSTGPQSSATPPPASSPGASSPTQSKDSTNIEKAAEKVATADSAPPQPAAPTQTTESASTVGAKIMQATEKSEEAANKIPMVNVGRNGQRPMPQKFPTERQGFTGTGNVPNPGRDSLGSIAYQIYFGVAA